MASGDAEHSEKSRALRHYLKTNFGVPGYETSWYDNILKVRVVGDTAEIVTNLLRGNTKVSDICSAVSGYVYSNPNRTLGLTQVRLVDQEGRVLIHRRSVGDSCATGR